MLDLMQKIPFFPSDVADENEQKCLDHIRINLHVLVTLDVRIEHCVALFSRARIEASASNDAVESFQFVSWMLSGARDAVLNLSGYGKVLHWLRNNTANCPTIFDVVQLGRLDRAGKLFDQKFPDIDCLRDAVAHPGEFSRKPSEIKRHANGIAFTSDDVVNDTYSAVYVSKLYSQKIDMELATSLREMTIECLAAYADVKARPVVEGS